MRGLRKIKIQWRVRRGRVEEMKEKEPSTPLRSAQDDSRGGGCGFAGGGRKRRIFRAGLSRTPAPTVETDAVRICRRRARDYGFRCRRAMPGAMGDADGGFLRRGRSRTARGFAWSLIGGRFMKRPYGGDRRGWSAGDGFLPHLSSALRETADDTFPRWGKDRRAAWPDADLRERSGEDGGMVETFFEKQCNRSARMRCL